MYPQLFPPASPDPGNNTDIRFFLSSGCQSAAHLEPEVMGWSLGGASVGVTSRTSSALPSGEARHFRSQGNIYLDKLATTKYQPSECGVKFVLMTLLFQLTTSDWTSGGLNINVTMLP
jgi:hypothetical protein